MKEELVDRLQPDEMRKNDPTTSTTKQIEDISNPNKPQC